MRGQLIKDWTKFDYENMEHRKALFRNLQFMFALPDKFIPKRFDANNPKLSGEDKKIAELFKEKREGHEKARLQYFANLNDFPATAKDVIAKFHEIPLYDNGFEEIFDVRDYSGSRKDGYSISTVQSGLTFRRMMTGEKLDVYQMSGEKEYVFFDYYGGALGWHRSLFENQDYWTIEDNAIEFRNEAYRIRATTFYALLEAAANALVAIPWQVSPDAVAAGTRGYLASRDAATLNLAAQTILIACQPKGYGISPGNANFIVLAPLQLRGRLRQALGVTYDNMTGSPPQIDYNFRLVVTTMLATTNRYMVILPKKKFTAGYRMELKQFTDFDILSYTDTVAGWMAFGGAVGDADQMEVCSIT